MPTTAPAPAQAPDSPACARQLALEAVQEAINRRDNGARQAPPPAAAARGQ